MASDIDGWTTGRLLATAGRLAERAWAQRLSACGLTHAGMVVLHVLAGGPLAAVGIAARCHVEAQTMTRTLDRLERDGFVTRERDPADRRRLLIHRTAAGARAYDQAVAAGRAENAVLGDVAEDPDFRAQLIRLVQRLGAVE